LHKGRICTSIEGDIHEVKLYEPDKSNPGAPRIHVIELGSKCYSISHKEPAVANDDLGYRDRTSHDVNSFAFAMGSLSEDLKADVGDEKFVKYDGVIQSIVDKTVDALHDSKTITQRYDELYRGVKLPMEDLEAASTIMKMKMIAMEQELDQHRKKPERGLFHIFVILSLSVTVLSFIFGQYPSISSPFHRWYEYVVWTATIALLGLLYTEILAASVMTMNKQHAVTPKVVLVACASVIPFVVGPIHTIGIIHSLAVCRPLLLSDCFGFVLLLYHSHSIYILNLTGSKRYFVGLWGIGVMWFLGQLLRLIW
jgi:hypothetical protein